MGLWLGQPGSNQAHRCPVIQPGPTRPNQAQQKPSDPAGRLKYDLGTLADSRNMGALLSVLTILPLLIGVLLETDFASLCSDAVRAIRSRLKRKPAQVLPNPSAASAAPKMSESSSLEVEAIEP